MEVFPRERLNRFTSTLARLTAGSESIHIDAATMRDFSDFPRKGREVMKRSLFLSFGAGVVLGAALFAANAQAAALPPISAGAVTVPAANVEPAVVSQAEVDRLKPVQVRWHHGWHHRHWGWRHRHWHRHWGWHHRHWGWRHRHWHHRHW